MEVFGRKLAERDFSLKVGNCELKWRAEKIQLGWKIDGYIKGKPGRLEVIRFDLPKKVLSGGWQSWSPFKVVNPREEVLTLPSDDWKYRDTPVSDSLIEKFCADYMVITEDKVYGFLTSEVAHPFFTVEDDSMVGYLDYFDVHFEDYRRIERFVILEGANLPELLERYAELSAEENGVFHMRKAPIGWCSWYHYYLDLKWEDVVKNLKLAKYFPFNVFQIDDAYETDIGDWFSTRDGFPTLEEISRQITNEGYTPGIWLAPFGVSESSKLLEKHPNWIVTENGKEKKACGSWGKDIYALDLTNEDVLEWIFQLFRSLRGFGYRYFKIDFLFVGAIPGKRRKSVTPIQAFRMGMKTIRKAVGDSFVLGCGAPLLPSVGYVDGMRIGPDTAPFWGDDLPDTGEPSAKYALRNAITRYFMNERLWINDPDCLLLRSEKIEMGENERKIYAYTAGILNNMIVVSDDLELIDDSGKKILKDVLKLLGGRSRVENPISERMRYEIRRYGTERKEEGWDVKLIVDLDSKEYELIR